MPALWFAIPIIIFAGWYATIEPRIPADGYALDATAKGSGVLPFVVPLCAGFAAWEASRLRRGGTWGGLAIRRSIVIEAVPLVPIVLVGTAAMIAAIVVELLRAGGGLPDVRVLVPAILMIVAWTAVGFLLGITMPFALAGPLAVVTPFIWFAFVPAIQPVWLRHMTGMFRDCCSLDQDLATSAVVSSAIVGLGLLVAVLVLTRPTPLTRSRVLGAAAVVLAALAGGAALVNGMIYAPVTMRDARQLGCSASAGATLCLWPEHAELTADLQSIITDVRSRWAAAGIVAPAIVTEENATVAPRGALAFQFQSRVSSRDDIIDALGLGLVPPFPDCPGGATGGIAAIDLEAWYASAGGMSQSAMQARFSSAGLLGYDPPLSVVAALERATLDDRRDWITRAEQISGECEDWAAERLRVGP